MPLLVFTTNLDKIRDGSKRQTIRKNADFWSRAYQRGQKLHVWFGSPRTGKGRKYGTGDMVDVTVVRGDSFTKMDAEYDGFQSLDDLIWALRQLHHMSRRQILDHHWAVIYFVIDGERNPWT